MPAPRRSAPADRRLPKAADLDALADAVTRLRRALRRVVRSDVPFETLSMAQIEVMQLLAERPGLRAGEVGEALLLAPTTVSTLVGALLAHDLIERQADPADRRAWRLLLTDDGEERLADWQQSNRRVMRDAAAHLSTDELQSLRAALPALSKLVTHLDSSRETDG
ncbi:MAG TPA: MarR family transcriptional regulator [Mycobacteriales bacterium]|jgi:DNA-binding MarR family transcriptional regulator|nr:MarR family transcriptional regulator [Mycobacteriales bacterium]